MKEEIPSGIKNLLAETQRELPKMLKPKTGECVNEEMKQLLKMKREVFARPLNPSG